MNVAHDEKLNGSEAISPISVIEVAEREGVWTDLFGSLARDAHANSVNHGWWDPGMDNAGEKIALMHSELSEALEALRKGNPPDKHLPEYSSLEVEMADVIIRIFDYAAAAHFEDALAKAILAKMKYNVGRPHRHGDKRF